MTERVDAELHEAAFVDYFGDIVVYGVISGDRKKRFPDGWNVRTSPVVSVNKDIVETLNSVYRVSLLPERVFSRMKAGFN